MASSTLANSTLTNSTLANSLMVTSTLANSSLAISFWPNVLCQFSFGFCVLLPLRRHFLWRCPRSRAQGRVLAARSQAMPTPSRMSKTTPGQEQKSPCFFFFLGVARLRPATLSLQKKHRLYCSCPSVVLDMREGQPGVVLDIREGQLSETSGEGWRGGRC